MREKLTPREQEILNLLLEGISPKEIGYKLNISYKTVDFHRSKIYDKLGVKNIQELLAMYGQQSTAANSVESHNDSSSPPPPRRKLGFLLENRRNKLLIPAAILILSVSILLLYYFLSGFSASKAIAEKPLTVILNDNEPYGYTFRFHPSALNGTIITAGDSYTLNYSFTSNVDIKLLYVHFLDQTIETDGFWTNLSSTAHLKGNIKTNIEYAGSLTIIPTKTASSAEPNANLLNIETKPYTPQQPTITFTKFELVKNN